MQQAALAPTRPRRLPIAPHQGRLLPGLATPTNDSPGCAPCRHNRDPGAGDKTHACAARSAPGTDAPIDTNCAKQSNGRDAQHRTVQPGSGHAPNAAWPAKSRHALPRTRSSVRIGYVRLCNCYSPPKALRIHLVRASTPSRSQAKDAHAAAGRGSPVPTGRQQSRHTCKYTSH